MQEARDGEDRRSRVGVRTRDTSSGDNEVVMTVVRVEEVRLAQLEVGVDGRGRGVLTRRAKGPLIEGAGRPGTEREGEEAGRLSSGLSEGAPLCRKGPLSTCGRLMWCLNWEDG